jgi:hypothetical protein
MGSFVHMAGYKSSSKKYIKNELNTRFEENFTTGSYGVGI